MHTRRVLERRQLTTDCRGGVRTSRESPGCADRFGLLLPSCCGLSAPGAVLLSSPGWGVATGRASTCPAARASRSTSRWLAASDASEALGATSAITTMTAVPSEVSHPRRPCPHERAAPRVGARVAKQRGRKMLDISVRLRAQPRIGRFRAALELNSMDSTDHGLDGVGTWPDATNPSPRSAAHYASCAPNAALAKKSSATPPTSIPPGSRTSKAAARTRRGAQSRGYASRSVSESPNSPRWRRSCRRRRASLGDRERDVALRDRADAVIAADRVPRRVAATT